MSEPDFEIEILEEAPEESGQLQLPRNFLLLGQVAPDDVKVYIHQKVYKALETYAASDTSKELGSILLGDYYRDGDKLHVVITDYIEAKYTDASAATLTFTHETWDYVHKEHARRFPDKKIIGWQHTHPTYGIFLSNYDLFIQENFFNLPFQIAYVIDPVQQLRGFFQWKNDKTVKLHGYHLYDEEGKAITLERKRKEAPKKKGSALMTTLICFLCVLCVGLGIISGVLYSRLLQQEVQLQQMQQLILEQQTQVTQITAQLQQKELTLQEQQALIAQLEALLNTQEETDTNHVTIRFTVYTVVPGDSLEGICAAQGIDYAENMGLILGVNGISDPDRIYVGQRLLLPINES